MGEATATIINDDSETPILRISDVTVIEGNSGSTAAVFAVTLLNPDGQTVSVQYTTQDNSAVAPDDYTATSGNLVFTPEQTSKEVTVQVQGDVIDEGVSEQFQVALSNAVNASISRALGIGTITDNDDTRLAFGSGPAVTEGDSGVTPAIFRVNLSTPAAFTVTVDYEVRSGEGSNGAFVGEDFTGTLTGTLTFEPGDTTKSFSVNIIGDTKFEPDEFFTAHLSNGSVDITIAQTTATIRNDDSTEEMERLFLPLIHR